MRNLYAASRQWAARPDDERFVSCQEYHEYVTARTVMSSEIKVRTDRLIPTVDDGAIQLIDETSGITMDLNYWSAGQVARAAKVPADYLRTLPPKLAVANLMYGLRSIDDSKSLLVMEDDDHTPMLRGMTSQVYGRIQDQDISRRLLDMSVENGGRWQIPAASYSDHDPKRATTLYASSQDIWAFMIDPETEIFIPGQEHPSFRGFFIWNSEVGAGSCGLMTFLYEYVCDNRIVWNVNDVQAITIAHRQNAGDRFLEEIEPLLIDYSQRSQILDLGPIKEAQRIRLNDYATDEDDMGVEWVSKTTGIGPKVVNDAFNRTLSVDHEPVDTVWDAVQSLTAYARSIPYTNRRVSMESNAAILLK